MSRVLGIDVGERRIGIAVSDLLGITAQGLETWSRKTIEEDINHILFLYDDYEATALVVGLPKNMNNTCGFKVEETKSFIDQILSRRALTIHWVDERMTTLIAERVLLEGDVSRKKRKKVVDKLAAVIILQSWLDGQR